MWAGSAEETADVGQAPLCTSLLHGQTGLDVGEGLIAYCRTSAGRARGGFRERPMSLSLSTKARLREAFAHTAIRARRLGRRNLASRMSFLGCSSPDTIEGAARLDGVLSCPFLPRQG